MAPRVGGRIEAILDWAKGSRACCAEVHETGGSRITLRLPMAPPGFVGALRGQEGHDPDGRQAAEIIGAQCTEVDLAGRLLAAPAARMKGPAGREKGRPAASRAS
jgi:hypothetical protein